MSKDIISKVNLAFDALASMPLSDPIARLCGVGAVTSSTLAALEDQCDVHPIKWRGAGTKTYDVFSLVTTSVPFSRAINRALFIRSGTQFEAQWKTLMDRVAASSGHGSLSGIRSEQITSLAYTSVIGFAAVMDLFGVGNRKSAGSLFEILIGAAVAALSGRVEAKQIRLLDKTSGRTESVSVDAHFPPASSQTQPTLVIASKISTRERISQAYVHQRMLDVLRPSNFRTIMAIGNENNVRTRSRTPRSSKTPRNSSVVDTLVPGTIRLYQRFISNISGLYYLDPPAPYLSGAHSGLPRVRSLGSLLTQDLPSLLENP